MIKIKRVGNTFYLICDCGNADSKEFGKIQKQFVTVGERGRKKYGSRLVHICNKCKTIITPEDVKKQLIKLSNGESIDDSLEVTVQ